MAKTIRICKHGTATVFTKKEQKKIAAQYDFTLQDYQELFLVDNSNSYPLEKILFVAQGYNRHKQEVSGYLYESDIKQWQYAIIYECDTPRTIINKLEKNSLKCI